MRSLFILLAITTLVACGNSEEASVSEESGGEVESFVISDEVMEDFLADKEEEESDEGIYAEAFSPSDEVVDELYDGEEYDINDIMAKGHENTRILSEPASVQLDSVTTTVTDGLISYHEVEELASDYGEDVEEGEMVPVMELDITLENDIDEARTMYIDQLTVLSSDGHQVDASARLSEPPIKDMLGAVKSQGTIVIPLSDANMWESEWVDVHIPYVKGADNETVADGEAIRIYFDEY